MAKATFVAEAKIEKLVRGNPKREGTAAAERFALYSRSKTVGAFLEKGGVRADLAWDIAHGYVKVTTPRKGERRKSERRETN